MLKIKDNVDLKELEKFGFKYKKEKEGYLNHYYFINEKTGFNKSLKNGEIDYFYDENVIKILERTKEIVNVISCRAYDGKDITTKYYLYYENDILYDLIKADLVEKVEE